MAFEAFEAFEELRGTIRGRVLTPGDADFEQAAAPWNTAVTQRPGGLARCAVAGGVGSLPAVDF